MCRIDRLEEIDRNQQKVEKRIREAAGVAGVLVLVRDIYE